MPLMGWDDQEFTHQSTEDPNSLPFEAVSSIFLASHQRM